MGDCSYDLVVVDETDCGRAAIGNAQGRWLGSGSVWLFVLFGSWDAALWAGCFGLRRTDVGCRDVFNKLALGGLRVGRRLCRLMCPL
jgi:hypothetical protein